MQTRALKTFERICQLGSFAKVAKEQNTTLSTLSMQIKGLENEFGVQLFDRSFRPPQLTPKGKQIAGIATELLRAERSIFEICDVDEELTGTYRIGFVATASVRVLPDFLSNAFKHAPNARFEIETALSETLKARLKAGHLDLAVLTETSKRENDLYYEILAEEKMVYAVPASAQSQSLKELYQDLPFLQFNPTSGIGELIEQFVGDFNVTADKSIVLESVEAIMACVNEGLGFTLLAEPDIQRYATENVKIVSPVQGHFSRRLSLAMTATKYETSDIRRLIALFYETNPT